MKCSLPVPYEWLGVLEHSVTWGLWAGKVRNSRDDTLCQSLPILIISMKVERMDIAYIRLKKIRLHSALANLFPKRPHFLDALKRHILGKVGGEAFTLIRLRALDD